MDLLDANILVGAFRPDDPDHAKLKTWLEETLNNGLAVTFPALVEVAFLRIVTHPRIFRVPSPLAEAVGFLRAIHESGLCRETSWTPRMRARWWRWCQVPNRVLGDSMSLVEIWTTNPDQLRGKHIQQIISFAGKGKLLDDSKASLEFRELLEIIPLEILRGYAEGCLQGSFPDNGLALQDIVNEVGHRLEFEIERGPYRGIKGKVGFDGIWRSDDERAIVVEVKTSDTYRIELDRLADYRKKLIALGTIPEAESSILIVVGSTDTYDLEAQVRGSRHAWEVRLISVQALLKLLDIKVRLEDPLVVQQIRSILTPQEYTRVDGIIDLVFLAAEDVTAEGASLGEGSEDVEREEDEKKPVDFNDECAERVQRHFRRPLVKQSRVTWTSPDNSLGLLCKTSRVYTSGRRIGYWFGIPSTRYKVLATVRDLWIAFGCGSPKVVLLVPYDQFLGWTNGLSVTTRKNRDFHWHVQIHEHDGQYELRRKKGFDPVDLTPYLLDISEG